MNILDAVIIVLFIIGIVGGMKQGVIKSTVALVGTIVVFVLAFYLKNPLASLFYTYLPFFNILNGAVVLNILLYEIIAFLIVLSVLFIVLKIIISVTGVIEKILNATIILGMVSKLLGAVVGFLESYVLVFIMLFILSQPFLYIEGTSNSKLSSFILNKSLLLTNTISKTNNSIKEIYSLTTKYEKNSNKDQFNYDALEILMKHKVVSSKSVATLKNRDKLNFDGVDILINKYGE